MLNTKNNLTSAGRARLLRQQRQYKIEEAKKLEEEQKEIQKKSNASIWEKIGDTLYDFGANLVGGASKAIEGVIDTGSALAGNVAGWFGADDFKQQMQENIAYDWTGNNITNPANEKTDASLLNDSKFGQYLEGMAQGIGQLLPTVAVSWIPGVAGLSKVMLFGSAMGNSTEQAVSEGADLGTASVYGALSGGVELLSERISGKLFGAGKIDRALGFKENLGRSLFKSAKSGLGRMAQEAVGEGLEEAFAEVVNPLLKKWTYDPDAKGATFSEIWDSAVVGALTSIAFGGTVGQLPRYKNASRVSRIQDQVNEYNDAVDKLYQDSTNGKLNAEERQAQQDELAKRKVIIEENISSIMQEFDKGWNITQKSRQSGKQEALKRINASGNLKMGLNSEGKLVNIQDSTNQQNESVNVVASLDKAGREVYKPVNRNEINQQAISSTLTGKENKIVYQPTNNEISPVMKESITMMADLSKAFGHNIDYVIADKNAMTGKKGAWDRTNNVLYLREDIDSSQVIQETIVHEFTHSLEGTRAYQGMADFVKSQLRFNKKLAKEFDIENFDADYNTLFNKYKKMMDKNLTKAEQKEYVDTELIAKYISEKLFTDKQSIQEVCKSNPTLAQKMFNWIKETFNKLTGKTKGERFAKTFLLKAKNLYSTAIQDAGVKRTIDNINSAETSQNLDKDSDVKYSYDDKKKYKNTPYSQWKSEALAWASRAEQDAYRGFYDGKGNFKVIIATGNDLVYDELVTVPENNQNLVTYYKGVIDGHNETLNRDANKLSRIAQRITNNIGFSNNNRSDVARRRTDSGIRTMDATKSNGNGKRNVKESSGNLSTKIKSYIYGDGYSTENVNPDEYNLVDTKEKGVFRDLLRELNNHIKTNKSMLQSKDLRIGLFNCLQNQKNNVYSKLAEINLAYEKTVSAYNKNNAINIPQTFIQSLGYNGVIDGKDGVVYDLNNKKKNLLDYSEDRAKERLDKAIRLFGETYNPAKAGWLLADGRFVDYHRDSANIFTGNILDYEDHWQIEKVFDTRRGTDAIDAFMAEGNIRLMPEAGGIELRGKPNKNQIDKLEDFINKVIDKEGITLDLRPVGTTEKHKPNPVSYDSTASAKEIMQDINSYYNTGKIAKVVDGVKFSLDEDIDTMLNDWWDNLSLEDLNEMIQDELKDFDTKEEVKLSKEERRELYVKKLYEEGKLNSVVTKLVNKNPQMKEYFKDTQMNMKYNPLSMLRTKGDEYIVMFHGTPNKNFNEFSPSFIGDNGSVMGEGFYFTESLEYANDYKQRDGRVISSLLDIKKPLSRNKVTITKDELKTFIQDVLVKHKNNYLENFNNDIDFTVNYWMNHYDNDIDLIQGMHEHSVMLWEDFYSGLRDSIGYDGVIAWNKAEGTQAIVFNSNQIKNIFNRKPTKSADIRYALEEDSDGNKLSEQQIKFFKDSKIRDNNGKLLRCYHSTNHKFNEFDKKKIGSSTDDGIWGTGFYFSNKYNNLYGNNVYEVYLNIKKPFIINKFKAIKEIADYLDVVEDNFYLRDGLIYFNQTQTRQITSHIQDLGYDGILVELTPQWTEVVAFESNQIKNTNNKTPTNSPDIRYSLTDSEGHELSKEQVEFFKNSKVRDKNGKLLTVYHGTNSEFFEFDKSKIKVDNLGKGFYFVNKREIADSYAIRRTEERGGKEKVISGYINSIKPFDISNISDEQIKSYLIYDYMNRKRPRYEYRKKHGAEIVDAEQYANDLMNDEDVPINDDGAKDYSVLFSTKEENFQNWLHENKYDCLIVEGEDSRTKIQGVAYVIFDSNKFKLTTNHNPTLSDDIRYSLEDNVDNTQSNNVEYKMLEGFSEDDIPLKLQDRIIAHLNTSHTDFMKYLDESIQEKTKRLKQMKAENYPQQWIENQEKRLQEFKNEKQERIKERTKSVFQRQGKWSYDGATREQISAISRRANSKGESFAESKEALNLFTSVVNRYKLYKERGYQGFVYDILDDDVLPAQLQDIKEENKTMGIETLFYIHPSRKQGIANSLGFDTDEDNVQGRYYPGINKIFLRINEFIVDENGQNFIQFNRHEKIHHYSETNSYIYSQFTKAIDGILSRIDKINLYNKYYHIYKKPYKLTEKNINDPIIWEEIYAQIYALNEKLSADKQSKIYDAIESFEESIKTYYKINNIQFSLDDDFDISDYYIPSDDGFFNAENSKLKGQTRDTDAIKYRAKLKQDKVFSKEELSKVINDALNQTQNMRLSGKVKDIAIGELFERMNTQDVYEKRKTAQDIANFIINNAFYDEIYTETYEQQVAEFELIDSHKGHFKLNDQIKQELDIKTENGARIVNAWSEKGYNVLADGTKKNKIGVNTFDVAEDLISQGLMIDTDKSETEIFLDIYERYNALDEAIKEFKAQQKELAKDMLDSVTMRDNKQALVDTILKAYDEKGSKTASAKLKELYHENVSKIKTELKDVKKYANAYVNYLVSNKRAKELVKGNKHYSAGILEDPTLKGFLKAIAQTGNIKTIKKTARARIQKLAEVYNTSKKGSLFNDILGQEQEMTEIFGVKDSVYDENIANMIEYIAQGQGELTTDEIILLTKITDGLIHLYTTYDKVFKNGKYVETEKLAKDYGEKMRVGIDVRNKSKFLKGMWRFRAMFDPHTVMRNLDGYRCEYNSELGVIEDRGFFTEMFQEITDGEVKANVAELELLKPFGDFFKANKKFERSLTKDKIKLNGTQIKTNGVKVKTEAEMSVGEAISIYLTSLRPQSNFYDSSVILQNKDKTTSEYSFDVKQINELFGKFTEAQKQYIKLVQKFFNEDAQKLKVETDLATLGYTNIEDSGVYFPINREKSAIGKNLGDTQVILDAINTYTLSFNKDVRPGAKLPIRISNVYGIVQNHARGMGAYYGLSVPLKTFNRVFNKQIESMGKQSLKRIASSQMYDSVAYIDKLLKDIQGRQYDNTVGGKALRWMRGNYAKFQLGFNPKTILGQTSSYMMASTYLDADALAKGLVMKTNTEQMFKYAPFTRYRMQEKTIVKAQGVIDKVGTWTDTFTKGIEWMDNNVVKKLWNASQVQIEKNTGHKIGTEENLNRASKLLEKVVRETQSNSIASEMTSLARSENEVIASFTMFSSDSQKQVSRFVDGLGLLSARKQWIANGTIKADDKIAKVAKKQIFRAGAGYVTATTMFVLIGMMMKHLLGKNDEDETITEEFFGDFKTQVAGLIPIYRDVYGFMNDGYELDNYAYGMINDALQGAKSMNQLAEDIISGKQLSKSEIGMPLRRSIYSLAQLFGVPVRNVWNYGYGIVNQFSPSTAYRMNSLFYDAKLTDLEKSIESGNDRKSLAIIKELFESKNLDVDNTYAKEVLELYIDGVNVIPGEIKETFTYNGEEITLTSSQHKQLLDAINKVLTNFNDVVKQAEYKKLSVTQKRTYLNNLYDINYILNLAQVIGLDNMKDSDIKKFLFASVLGNDLISYMAYIKTFESDKDKEGNTITNSKKTNIQNWVKRLKLTPAEKYLLMGFAGYKNINGESTVNVYLRRKGLSKDERELILKWCGY